LILKSFPQQYYNRLNDTFKSTIYTIQNTIHTKAVSTATKHHHNKAGIYVNYIPLCKGYLPSRSATVATSGEASNKILTVLAASTHLAFADSTFLLLLLLLPAAAAQCNGVFPSTSTAEETRAPCFTKSLQYSWQAYNKRGKPVII